MMLTCKHQEQRWKLNGPFPEAQGEVLLGLANGMSDKEMARQRGCSPKAIEMALYRIKEKMFGKMQPYGKRTKVLSEAIRRGWISPLAVFVIIGSLFSGMLNPDLDVEVRRNSSRLNSRTVARMMRGRKTRREPFIDIDVSELDQESMAALLELQSAQPNRLAPWSSVAWTRLSSVSNSDRLEMWRSMIEKAAA